jgi:hypothetical protein
MSLLGLQEAVQARGNHGEIRADSRNPLLK